MPETILITSIFVCLIYIIAEKYAHDRQSGHLDNILNGNGSLWILNIKYLIGIILFTIPLLQWIYWGNSTNIFSGIKLNISGIVIWILAMLLSIFSVIKASRNQIKTLATNKFAINHTSQDWTGTLLLRTFFLLMYEIFMRGVFLFASIELLDIPLAVLLNVSVYFIMHIYSNRKTLLGTIPFGLVLCWLSIQLNSVWPVALLHVSMAILYEIRLLSHLQKTFKPVAK
jgi:hypothetical protein